MTDSRDSIASDASAGNRQLDARYGRTPDRERRDRAILWVGGVVGGVVVLAWLVWAGLGGVWATLQYTDAGHRINDEFSAEVTFRVTTDPANDVSCAVQVLNELKATVGWKIVDLPPTTSHSRLITETVRTSELGVSGLIYRCWLT
ncbi:MAG TPA: DUF4307 domain-containing protein [Terrimesophilobacter sp.]|nr:DUF4307 domain-containing protein [Terrimesophilobacter sp.]HRQ00751.1 DUF4307 domain-containing protein [Terrimesophilobacter sp.]